MLLKKLGCLSRASFFILVQYLLVRTKLAPNGAFYTVSSFLALTTNIRIARNKLAETKTLQLIFSTVSDEKRYKTSSDRRN